MLNCVSRGSWRGTAGGKEGHFLDLGPFAQHSVASCFPGCPPSGGTVAECHPGMQISNKFQRVHFQQVPWAWRHRTFSVTCPAPSKPSPTISRSQPRKGGALSRGSAAPCICCFHLCSFQFSLLLSSHSITPTLHYG